MFFVLAVFAGLILTQQLFKSRNLKNRPSASMILTCTESVSHVLAEPLMEPSFSVGFSNIENVGRF